MTCSRDGANRRKTARAGAHAPARWKLPPRGLEHNPENREKTGIPGEGGANSGALSGDSASSAPSGLSVLSPNPVAGIPARRDPDSFLHDLGEALIAGLSADERAKLTALLAGADGGKGAQP
jgi:hypothetical protein